MAKKTDEKKITTDEEISALIKIKGYKDIVEENLIGILWNNTDFYFYNDNLKIDKFTNSKWSIYFQIGYDVLKEGKVLDENTIDIYLNKHDELRVKYDNFGGYETASRLFPAANKGNVDGYIKELEKWTVVMQMVRAKFPVAHKLKDYVDMTVEDIYNENEATLNAIFLNVSGDDVVYKLSYNIDKLIDALDEGFAVGLPFNDAPMLNREIGGQALGSVTLVGGLSGVGKTSVSRVWLIPSVILNNEKLVVMINEEGLAKWQRELLVWVANNIYKEDIQKYTIRNGGYTKEFKAFLKEKCGQWIKDNDDNVILIPFKKYTTAKAIKTIKKYAHIGVNYFMLDTFKADSGVANSDAFWFNMQQSMVEIYDEVKPEALNVHILVTFQLAKSSSKNRYYTQDNIGMAKNIVDVASTCIMLRHLYDDELPDGKSAIEVFKIKGKTKVPVKLDKKKHYMVIFIIKNREGSSNEFQIVAEVDLSRNTYEEIGFTCISPDF